jgi:hypothetical protein
MQTQRIVTQVDATGHLIGLPLLPPGQMVEVIMSVLDKPTRVVRRKPPKKLQSTVRIIGDVLSTASSEDWGIS